MLYSCYKGTQSTVQSSSIFVGLEILFLFGGSAVALFPEGSQLSSLTARLLGTALLSIQSLTRGISSSLPIRHCRIPTITKAVGGQGNHRAGLPARLKAVEDGGTVHLF